jgi:hypothetical protein
MARVSDGRALSHVRIGLYVAVPSALEDKPIQGSWFAKCKSAFVRLIDTLNWHLFRRGTIRYHHWDTRYGSNKGDAAIRESTKDTLRAALAPIALEFEEFEWGQLAGVSGDRISDRWDAFVVGGSGYVTSDEYGNVSPRMDSDLPALKLMNCEKILFGVGWNTLLTEGGKIEPLSSDASSLVKRTYAEFGLCSVRDSATKLLFDNLSDTSAFLMGDPALFWYPKARYLSLPKSPDVLRVGLNFALHGSIGAARFEKMFDTYCVLLGEIQRRHRVEFHHVRHSYAERLVPSIFRSRGIRITGHNPRPDQLIDLYSQLDLHICEMMHSSILSMAAGTPAINLAYDIKNVGFYDLMQLPQFCHPIWGLDHGAFLSSVDEAIADRNSFSKNILLRKQELQGVQEIFMRDVRNRLAPRPCKFLKELY